MTHFFRTRVFSDIVMPLACLTVAVSAWAIPLLMADGLPVTVHDYLDMVFPWRHLGGRPFLLDPSFFSFDPCEFESRARLPVLRFGAIFYMLLTPKMAYIATMLCGRILAFSGMWLLLRELPRGRALSGSILASVLAAIFASLPVFWDQHEHFTDALLPFVLWAYVSVRKRGFEPGSVAALVIPPFFASYHFSMLFVTGYAILFAAYSRDRRLFAACLVSLAAFGASHYDHILAALHYGGFHSHRELWAGNASGSLSYYLDDLAGHLFKTDYHVSSLHVPLVLPVCLAACILSVVRRLREGRWGKVSGLQSAVFAIIIANCVAGPLPEHCRPVAWLFSNIPGLGLATFRPFYMNQALWHVCFFLSLLLFLHPARLLPWRTKRKAWLLPVVLLACCQLAVAVRAYPTAYDDDFESFFARTHFARVRDLIGRDQAEYRVASFGFFPSVAVFNGFRSVDAYSASYDLSCYRKMKIVTARELAGDDDGRYAAGRLFDGWGSRRYLFLNSGKDEAEGFYQRFIGREEAEGPAVSVDFDCAALRDMGAGYVISRREILWKDGCRSLRLLGEAPRLPGERSDYAKLYVYAVR